MKDRYEIAKEVELEDFRNAIACVLDDTDDISDDDLKEMYEEHQELLANDDTYGSIYNEMLCEVLKQHKLMEEE